MLPTSQKPRNTIGMRIIQKERLRYEQSTNETFSIWVNSALVENGGICIA